MTVTDTGTLVDRFNDLEVQLNTDLLERHTEIKTAIVALLARRHHFQVGPPGVAKSLLVRRLAARIGGFGPHDYFQWLLTKYTTPAEVFGPPSLKALENDEYRLNTAGKLPVARIAFLDEIFKANSSILNAFLTIMNERLFFNNGASDEIPLQCIFAASNEMPQGDELNALWDRLHFRHEVRPMNDGGNFVKMLKGTIDPNPVPSCDLTDLAAAQEVVEAIKIPSDIYDAIKTLRDNLRTECGIEPTERRFVECIPIIKATAFLNGRDIADIDDMRLLRHVLWYRTDDQKVVSQQVLQLSNPVDKAAQDLLDQIEILSTELDEAVTNSDNHKKLAQQAVQVHARLRKAKKELDVLKTTQKDSGRTSEILDSLNDRFASVSKRLMKEAFHFDPKKVQGIQAAPELPEA